MLTLYLLFCPSPVSLTPSISCELANLGEISSRRILHARTAEYAAPVTPAPPPAPHAPASVPTLARVWHPRSLISIMEAEGEQTELTKFLSLGFRTSDYSPFGVIHFSGPGSEHYAATHHPLAFTSLYRSLFTKAPQPQRPGFFLSFDSKIVQAQAAAAESWMDRAFEVLPFDDILAYPFSGWKQKMPSQSYAIYFWQQLWASVQHFVQSNAA